MRNANSTTHGKLKLESETVRRLTVKTGVRAGETIMTNHSSPGPP
jgi:hypothetical protein